MAGLADPGAAVAIRWRVLSPVHAAAVDAWGRSSVAAFLCVRGDAFGGCGRWLRSRLAHHRRRARGTVRGAGLPAVCSGAPLHRAQRAAGPLQRGERFLNNITLYLITTMIWGSTWLVIKFQLGQVSPVVSVVWRFGLAALMLAAFALVRGRTLKFPWRSHGWIALQGLLLFGLNYIGVYLAEQYLTSGLVAVVFSLVVFLNTLGMRLFFGLPIRPSAIVAATLGVAGVALIFGRE